MIVVGLTGGIGSGKSTIANEFKKFGVPVYIADERSKYILSHQLDVIDKVIDLLGEKAYIKVNDTLVPDKAFIASLVFNNAKLLRGLNEILHPAVRIDFNRFLKDQVSPYVIYEAAILFESGGDINCDYVVLVTAPIEERIRRVTTRDNISEDQVRSRMQHQWPEQKKIEKSDIVFENINHSKIYKYSYIIHHFLLNN